MGTCRAKEEFKLEPEGVVKGELPSIGERYLPIPL